jgi:homogentisate 1,2-dioxygenase
MGYTLRRYLAAHSQQIVQIVSNIVALGQIYVLILRLDQQTWLYRIIPAANHGPFTPEDDLDIPRGLDEKLHFTPTQIRWDPFDFDQEVDWVHSSHLLCGAGNISSRSGLGYFIFTAGQSMDPKSAFYSADGDLLIILQHGVLDIRTELGHLLVRPNEICVIPRGIR